MVFITFSKFALLVGLEVIDLVHAFCHGKSLIFVSLGLKLSHLIVINIDVIFVVRLALLVLVTSHGCVLKLLVCHSLCLGRLL